MISKSFGLLFYFKKQHGDTKVHRPIYLRITENREWMRPEGLATERPLLGL